MKTNLGRIRKSLVKSSVNLSSSVITFYHSENSIAQLCHGVHIFILSVPFAELTNIYLFIWGFTSLSTLHSSFHDG